MTNVTCHVIFYQRGKYNMGNIPSFKKINKHEGIIYTKNKYLHVIIIV